MSRARTIVPFLAAAFLFVSASGCYTFTGASVPPNLKTIAIPLVDDQSGFGEPGLREQFTTALTNLFISDNSLEVADRTTADAIMVGVITSVSDAPAVVQQPIGQQGATQQGEQVSKRRITLTVKVALQDVKLRKNMWEKSFSNWGDYDAGGGGASQRQTGLTEAIRKVTEDILLETVSGW
jgi:hypothetical protein